MRVLLRVVLPLLLLAGALLGGAAAGDLLRRPDSGSVAGGDGDAAAAEGKAHAAEAPAPVPEANDRGAQGGGDLAYLKFPQQFFVPIVRGGTLQAVMILALSLEMPADAEEPIVRQEHRLRDALLRSLLIHANSGGFDGNFTAEARMELLRETLLATARKVAGPEIGAVLIGDIARQEQ